MTDTPAQPQTPPGDGTGGDRTGSAAARPDGPQHIAGKDTGHGHGFGAGLLKGLATTAKTMAHPSHTGRVPATSSRNCRPAAGA